jgi:hypothetical protein
VEFQPTDRRLRDSAEGSELLLGQPRLPSQRAEVDDPRLRTAHTGLVFGACPVSLRPHVQAHSATGAESPSIFVRLAVGYEVEVA